MMTRSTSRSTAASTQTRRRRMRMAPRACCVVPAGDVVAVASEVVHWQSGRYSVGLGRLEGDLDQRFA